MFFYFLAIILSSTNSIAETPTPIADRILLDSTQCHGIYVYMNSGEIKSERAESQHVFCSKPKDYSSLCEFYDSKGKKFSEMTMVGGFTGSEGALVGDRGPVDSFIINRVTNKFYYETSARIDGGRVQFKKVCSGNWVYVKDGTNKIKNKKN